MPGKNHFGVIPGFSDQPIFAQNITRFAGEAVAAVVGEPKALRKFEPDSFPIKWEREPAVLEPAEATVSGAPLLHAERPNNILTEGYVASGNAEVALLNSVYVIENRYKTPFIEHAYIEPEAGYALRDGDRIIIQGCTQAPFMNLSLIHI